MLDEPTAGVDPKARRDFWSEIHELAADGLTVLVSTHYMDEAERCHEIAYIAFGEVLARGTVEDVILNSQLTTFTVSSTESESLARLSGELSGSPGVDMVAPFGNSLHVSGRDHEALEAAIAPYRDRPRSCLASARLHRSKTCSSISWRGPGTISNERASRCIASRRRLPAPRRRDAAQGIAAVAARPRHARHDDFDTALAAHLFGYAINTTPRNLPTAVLLQESSDVGRSILAAIQNTKYFKVTRQLRDEAELDEALKSGQVLFAVEIPANFERALRRGDDPALLVAADATDPVATGPAIAALSQIVTTALAKDRGLPDTGQPLFEIRAHERYNPAASTPLNIVPGLLGTILTLTMLIFTALSVTRETERGTMESLLAMPITPFEIMLGKIAPYVLVGFLQAALILAAGVAMFGVPIIGSLTVLAALTTLFIATNLAWLHLLDARAEPASSGADVDDVLPAQHAAVGFHLSVSRHAALGAIYRRVSAAHPLHPHRARDHAERRDAVASRNSTRWRSPV